MREIEVETNPNSPPSDQALFSTLGDSRPIRGIRAEVSGADTLCDVVGVGRGGEWIKAHAQRVADSGEGAAFLIYGGPWGIRLRPAAYGSEPWAFSNPRQWGEPYKIYGSESDILYE